MSDDKVRQPVASPQDQSPQDRSPQDQMLDLELEDSFPASDPPQTTQPHVHVGGPHRPATEADRVAKRPARPEKSMRR